MDKTFGKTRRWLNPKAHSDTGMISWDVSASGYSVEAEFSMWDCSRKINLDFNVYNEKDARDRAAKLDILIEELTKMREAMADAYAHYTVEKDKRGDTFSEAVMYGNGIFDE